MAKKRILVVEDESDMAALLKTRLDKKGYEAIVASDGKEGFDKAKAEKPDLVILDLMLPKVDGFWICNILKHDKRYSETPIIILTARSEKTDMELANECGADCYMIKPFEFDELARNIEKLLKKRKKQGGVYV